MQIHNKASNAKKPDKLSTFSTRAHIEKVVAGVTVDAAGLITPRDLAALRKSDPAFARRYDDAHEARKNPRLQNVAWNAARAAAKAMGVPYDATKRDTLIKNFGQGHVDANNRIRDVVDAEAGAEALAALMELFRCRWYPKYAPDPDDEVA